jgi:hypothetical protein
MILVAYLTLTALTAALWKQPLVLSAAHIVLGIVLLWRWHGISDVIIFVTVGAFAAVADLAVSQSGAWQFAGDRILPIWLPTAWASTGLVIARLTDYVREWMVRRGERSDATIPASPESLSDLRIGTTRVLVGAIVCATLVFIVLITAQLVWVNATPDTWLLRLIKQRYAALIQTPLLAGLAFCIVCLLEVVAGEKVEFEAPGFKFRGAAGPVVLWIFVFLALATITYAAWSLPGLAE